MQILPYSAKYKNQTIDLILNILEGEFGLYGINRPDLQKISETYQKNKGDFWVAIEKNQVVGTIALCNYEKNRGYLKRFYVQKNYRGSGVADSLFFTCIKFARKNKYKEIYLGTLENMLAANKYYIKKGFKRIEHLPQDIPSLGDTMFYQMDL